MIDFYPFIFETTLTQELNGKRLMSPGIVLDKALTKELPFDRYPKLRVDGEINGFAHQGAFVPIYGGHYMMVSKRLRKAIGIELGDLIAIHFKIADQNAVPIPAILQEAFEDAPDARDLWDDLPVGKRRSWCVQIDKAKAHQTKQNQISKLFDLLYNG
ncbi:YdeI/OmpD-associated family protein [Yoonia sp. GPGPB17]|uniref:YdeI/OmpD-associated family protein n=1 Tax=Yoonia sp. GPGPB17 TaxID=3026147 RepID=UPI0030C3747B